MNKRSRIGNIDLNAGWENARSIYELTDHLGNMRVTLPLLVLSPTVAKIKKNAQIFIKNEKK